MQYGTFGRPSRYFLVGSLSWLGVWIIGCPGTPTMPDDDPTGDPVPDVVLNVTKEGQGEVTQSADGTTVTLTAVPEPGWQFDSWGGADTSNQNPLTITASDSTVLSARFIPIVVGPTDSDGDEVADANDDCPGTTSGATVNDKGCATNQLDSDSDGVFDDVDACAATTPGTNVDSTGCETADPDADNDGVLNATDVCPGTPAGETADVNGCAMTQLDADNDGVNNSRDRCALTPAGATVNADGCSAAQRDTDNDGVMDNADECDNTASGTMVDAKGCPATDAPDADNDGVSDAVDQCPGTPVGQEVDASGCRKQVVPGGGGGGGGGTTDTDLDDDGVANEIDNCPGTPAGTAVDSNGCSPADNDHDDDGVPNGADNCAGTLTGTPVDVNGCPEVCGRASGDCFVAHDSPGCADAICCNAVCAEDMVCCSEFWDETCNRAARQLCIGAPPLPVNDDCSAPTPVLDGSTAFTNTGATTDGPSEFNRCIAEPNFRIGADVWFSYTATCTGTAAVSLCGSRYDTTLVVYDGSACPTTRPLACDDDDACLVLESRVTLNVVQGQPYLIRVGGFDDSAPGIAPRTGDGTLTIRCGDTDVCTAGTGDCMAADGARRGCDQATCCNQVCSQDPSCCDVGWDAVCVQLAEGLCGGSFAECGDENAGACNSTEDGRGPGCQTVTCCNSVCTADPYCCVSSWDQTCVNTAATTNGCP